MNVTYVASSNTATNGQALANAAGMDILVKKLIIGLPVSAGNIILYNKLVAYSGDTSQIGAKITLPTFSTTNVNPGVYVFDFGPEGLPLDGGNLMIDQTMQVSVIWEYKDDNANG